MSVSKLKSCFEQVGSITKQEDWDMFLAQIQKFDLLPPADVNNLNKHKPVFPASFETILSILSCLGKSSEHFEIVEQSLQLQTKLLHLRDSLEVWNLDSLDQSELAQLLLKLTNSYHKIQDSSMRLEEVADKIQSYSEDAQRLVYDNIIERAPIPSAAMYQDSEQTVLEKMWHNEKVRAVQYRNRAIRVLKRYENGVIRQIGFCARRDIPVDVMKVPRALTDYKFLTEFFYTISALKQLYFSKYFHHYLGFDDLTEEEYNLYFFDVLKGLNLGKGLVNKTIHDKTTLLKHWSKELMCAFTDLLHKTTHSLLSPVTLSNVFIQDDGVKLYLKGIEFGPEELNDQDKEAKLLHMYGNILFHLVTGSPVISDIFHLNVHPGLKCIMEECVKEVYRKKDRKTVMEPKMFVREGLTFGMLQTHPYFGMSAEEETYFFDNILDEYNVLFAT